jgi:hypothetical protein
MGDFDEDELVQLSFLRDEETDALIAGGFLSEDVRLSSPLDGQVTFTFDDLVLHVRANCHYPAAPIQYSIENLKLPREAVDGLRKTLKHFIRVADETNNKDRWRDREAANQYGIFEPVQVVLRLAQQTADHLAAFHKQKHGFESEDEEEGLEPDKHLWFLDGDAARKPVTPMPFLGASTKELAYQLLGLSPAQVAATIPSHFRVMHVEQVLRADLAQRLQRYQASLRETLSRVPAHVLRQWAPHNARKRLRDADVLEHLVRPQTTYHGTQRRLIPSIVRHGFVAPGHFSPATGEALEVRCGSTYGRGIYSSPEAGFALSYSGDLCERTTKADYFGLKLVVCATVMGRSRVMYRDDEWRHQDQAYEGCDSHVANDGHEYIVFDAAQVVPVYVVHLDWGADNAEYFAGLPNDPTEWTRQAASTRAANRLEQSQNRRLMLPGDVQREKEAVYARAAKWFPYGYGPASGSRFVVEAIGDVSDDDEDYGEYQALRVDARDDGAVNTDFWAWVKAAEEEEEVLREGARPHADVYAYERGATAVPQGFGRKADVWDEITAPTDGAKVDEVDDGGYDLAMLMLEDEQGS